jgi:hypothetical protein
MVITWTLKAKRQEVENTDDLSFNSHSTVTKCVKCHFKTTRTAKVESEVLTIYEGKQGVVWSTDLSGYVILPNHRNGLRLPSLLHLFHPSPNSTIQDWILTCSATSLFMSRRRWLTYKKPLVTTRFTTIAVEIPMIKTSFLQNKTLNYDSTTHLSGYLCSKW